MTDDEDTSEMWWDHPDLARWRPGDDDEGGADRPSHDQSTPHGQA